MDRARAGGRGRDPRKDVGAYYTPPALVAFLVDQVVRPAFTGRSAPPTVIDPACGDGRLLAAAGAAISNHFGVDPRPYLTGVEIDPAVAASTRERLGCTVVVGDGRTVAPAGAPFDVVIGNPPYLSQLSAATARGGRSSLGGGPYADVAAEFLARSLQLVVPGGGRVGLVLPLSIVATKDVAPIRAAVEAEAAIDVWWWADVAMFDAAVRTGIVGLVSGGRQRLVRRFTGTSFTPLAPVAPGPDSTSWSWLLADVAGVPSVEVDESAGRLGDLAVVTADFRDQYYGLVGAVRDDGDGPPLVTSGLIDAGACRWGERPTRFAKQRYAAPRVRLDVLSPALQVWAASRLVPKVLVASQTRVIEAVVDEAGAWLPSVPVVSVLPRVGVDPWRLAAVLTSPVASAWLAGRRFGNGLSAAALRVSARDLARVPLPPLGSEWDRAAVMLRAGDVEACGRAMVAAHGIADVDALLAWWLPAAMSPGRRVAP